MTELTLHSRAVGTVFDLLGSKEDDITYSVGWGLGQSERFTRSVLSEAYGDAKQGEVTAGNGGLNWPHCTAAPGPVQTAAPNSDPPSGERGRNWPHGH